MKNILFITPLFDPGIGGIQRVVSEVTKRLQSNYTITILTTSISGRKVSEYHPRIILDKENFDSSILNEFDLIILFDKYYWGYDLVKGWEQKTVFVPTGILHFKITDQYDFTEYKNRVSKFLGVVFHDELSEEYELLSPLTKHAYYISNGADDNVSTKKKARLGTRILHVGTATGSKGHHEVLRLFSESFLPFAKLTLATQHYSATEGYYDTLADRVRRFNSSRKSRLIKQKIELISGEAEQIKSLFRESDVFVFPSYHEVDPLVIYEAMASKTAFLASPVGSISSLVKKYQCGALFTSIKSNQNGTVQIDIEKSKYQFNQFCMNKIQARILADKAYDIFKENFTWDIVAEKYESMIQKLTQ